ncbi:ASCH domain-containing protein [Brevibacillus brevis]|uniref:ASCH domain-containing protein n=1 Tax=Brevibacillus brevis TaxID=1393 RepID=A0A517I953_BREBE|nr:ASCH domain-containing protein [Brevibacillus brevis]
MKAITIHQPFPTLIALGEKQFETRGWSTKYRGQIEIHAAKKVDKGICLQEDSFGWFETGRCAWEMTDVKPINPVPVKGQQGLWNWNYGKCINCKEVKSYLSLAILYSSTNGIDSLSKTSEAAEMIR